MKSSLLFSAVASASLVTGLGAQVTSPRADSSCTKYSDGRVECRAYRRGPDSTLRTWAFYRDSTLEKRAALGLELRTTGTKRDTLGVFVEGVTPKGPAEVAGIVEGDRIAAINGVDLRTSTADAEDSYASGLASHRLTREVQKLTPGARVTLRVYSGGRFRDVQVTAGKASDVMRLGNGFNFGMPGMDGMMQFDGPGMMMVGPEMQILRERMPMIRQQLEPMLRERMDELPKRLEMRAVPRIRTRTLAPLRVRAPQIYKVDRGAEGWKTAGAPVMGPIGESGDALMLEDMPQFDEPYILDLDDEPFDFEEGIEPINPEVIRELVAITVQDARVALKHLAADGIA
jgi:hypothetical protein